LALVILTACGGGDGGGGGGGNMQPGPTTGSIRGTVTDNTAAAVSNATVGLTGNSQPARNTTTSSTGSYSFATVPPGSYTVTVTPPSGFNLGGASGTAAVTVQAGQESTVGAFTLARDPTPVQIVNVIMDNTAFSPTPVTVPVGGAVRFTNNDSATHNATSSAFATGNINPGQNRVTGILNTVGTITYECTLHAGMTGTINVQ
jgi:plastocyanin